MNEPELIRRCQNGDQQAFEELLGNYELLIYNLTFRYFGNHHDASDLGQEAMVRVYHKIHEFNGRSTFKTWLYRVVTNLCLDELRRRKHQAYSLEELKEKGVEPAAAFRNPEDEAEHSEQARLIQEVLLGLSLEHRTIIILRDIEGLDYNEIARIIGCGVGTVKSRLSRAREAFRKQLAGRPRYSGLLEGRMQA
ncbi:RNA polymerase RpoE-like sigma-24 subunit [Hydrogenispora ethanolica]|jgi:RNA polymerase sigma-70 factor (ECF subfamily)|uniref:RNA polymerase RpoE-like sigma-24 subunit n=1 Tax=Hydrogenispora ethanolica TaxID=1082276 RepID=A0A4R1RFN8_HYDET|nr:sigma-70 family RNA polymerase sigma factor [Hydrogenispora ethanolica]TCL64751.1 RNA polymerase RpoE-like sigma-24 subunit [Hydrogenispora ethanolica]